MTFPLRPFTFAAGLLLALPALAQPAATPLTLGDWIARDRAIAGLGPGEPRDAQLQALHRATVEALQAARKAQDAKRAAGQAPDACLPPPGETQMTSNEIGTWLYARPASEHGESLETVLTRFLVSRFPCP